MKYSHNPSPKAVKSGLVLLAALAMVLISLTLASSQTYTPPYTIRKSGMDKVQPRSVVLPYAFYTDSFELTGGLAWGTGGKWQDQMATFVTGMGTSNSTWAFMAVAVDAQLPKTSRLFVSPIISVGNYTKQRFYAGHTAGFPNERGGSSGSSKDNYLEGEGYDNWAEARFKYVLPMGSGRHEAITNYVLDRGMLVQGASGGEVWNPLKSGLTLLHLRPFYRSQSLKHKGREESYNTFGAEFKLVHDNRDFAPNPSTGSVQSLAFARDFGWPHTTDTWSSWEVEFSKYFDLGANKIFRQQVLALNLWSAYSPTWEDTDNDLGQAATNRPPPYFGPRLGGFYRMRGYPQNRFSDQAAVYYGAEYRMTFDWNPLGEISWLKYFDIDWMQLAAFAELGNVAPALDIDDLHSDMKWDAGVGFRLMITQAVVRLDVAYSDEGSSAWAMVGHPF